jgi:uncharacterized protein (TIGR00288 family)
MNNSNEERLKIAVLVDFDNIAIGVKQSLNRNFDIGTVLEAIKERGEVITKIAYGDWKRAEDYSRAMTQHAVQMVQRNLTPGGDKNGADIALALDALEMAFTRDHINAFVIVGGDSDFIALVEKLKQYDKTVFVVGGRQFTSVILQKNCHEFISYENLIGIQSGVRKEKAQASPTSSLENALPLIRRALKVLSDREVSPQLGLLKSTLLQLDSTFSERDYGVSSFRDFTQKLADAGYVNLKQVDRSLLVELREGQEEGKEVQEASAVTEAIPESTTQQEPAQTSAQAADSIRVLLDSIKDSKSRPHWPMYLRTFKQYLRSLQPSFDERQFGFSSTYELVRQAQREGVLRVERNRQGILRIFPADRFPRVTPEQPTVEEPLPVAAEPELDTPAPEPEAVPTPAHEPEPAFQMEIPMIVEETGPGTFSVEEPAASTGEPEPQLEAEPSERPPLPQAVAEDAAAGRTKPKRRRKAASAATSRPRKTRKTVSSRQ